MDFTAFFCDHAETCGGSKLNIHGVFNELYAPQFPARQDVLYVAGIVQWEHHDHGRYPFRIDLTHPSGRPIFTIEGFTEVEARSEDQAPAKTHLVFPLENLVFTSPGRYRLQVQIKDRECHGPSLFLMKSSARSARSEAQGSSPSSGSTPPGEGGRAA